MLEYIISLALILLITGLYKYIIKPKRSYDRYVRSITKLGYQVYETGFNPFGHFFAKSLNDGRKQGDPMLFWRSTAPNTDVIVGNIFHHVSLALCHPDFIKDYYSNEHLFTFPKARMMTAATERATGKGVIFSEG